MRLAVLTGSVVAIVLVGIMILGRTKSVRVEKRESPDAQQELRAQVAKLERHTRTLQGRVALAERSVAQRTVASEDGPAEYEDAGLTVETEVSWQEREERDRRLVEIAQRVMEETLGASAANATWTQETEMAVAGLLSERQLTDVGRVNVNCRERLCRVAIEHADGGSWKALRELLGKAPFNSDFFYKYDREAQTTYVYMARRGERLPDLKQELQANGGSP